jgi:hypothetical protein
VVSDLALDNHAAVDRLGGCVLGFLVPRWDKGGFEIFSDYGEAK